MKILHCYGAPFLGVHGFEAMGVTGLRLGFLPLSLPVEGASTLSKRRVAGMMLAAGGKLAERVISGLCSVSCSEYVKKGGNNDQIGDRAEGARIP